jgi:hypothetical protein
METIRYGSGINIPDPQHRRVHVSCVMKRIVLLKGRERETGGETPYSLDDYIFSLEARGGMPDPYSGQYHTVHAEMEFLNGIFSRGFWA